MEGKKRKRQILVQKYVVHRFWRHVCFSIETHSSGAIKRIFLNHLIASLQEKFAGPSEEIAVVPMVTTSVSVNRIWRGTRGSRLEGDVEVDLWNMFPWPV
jgi:hypothetical protein